jgi:protein-S-isoprenylcysteine O-methyltransferase Ste14
VVVDALAGARASAVLGARAGAGGILLVAGLIALVQAFVRFVVEGFGTPAPVAAPDRLIVGGVYRCVRNPMYVAALAAIIGQALLLGRVGLLLYAGAAWLVVAAFVRWYEEPPPSPAASARTTRPTGAQCPRGGHACAPGNLANVTN